VSRYFELLLKVNRAEELFAGPSPVRQRTAAETPVLFPEENIGIERNNPTGAESLDEPGVELADVKGPVRGIYSEQKHWKQLIAYLLHSQNPATGCSVGICPIKRGESALGLVIGMAGHLGQCTQSDTAIVDATFRRSALSRVFGVPDSPGLSEMLWGEPEAYSRSVHGSSLGRLWIVPAGYMSNRRQPGDLVDRFLGLYEILSSRFRNLIFILPPANDTHGFPFPYSALRGVVLVVRPYTTGVQELQKAIGHLLRRNANLLGTILAQSGGKSSVLSGILHSRIRL
jgi:hypothetical protein